MQEVMQTVNYFFSYLFYNVKLVIIFNMRKS